MVKTMTPTPRGTPTVVTPATDLLGQQFLVEGDEQDVSRSMAAPADDGHDDRVSTAHGNELVEFRVLGNPIKYVLH